MIDGVEALRKLTMTVAGASGLTKLARPFFGGIGAILMLHKVSSALAKATGLNRHLCVHPHFLDTLLGDMQKQGYRFVSMDQAIELIRAPDGGAPFAAITLDDGYRDNLTEALPVFEKHSAPFTVYIAPGLIDGKVDLWWEIVEDLIGANEQLELKIGATDFALDTTTQREKARAFRTLLAHLTQTLPEREQPAAVAKLAQDSRAARQIAATRRLLMTWDEIRTLAAHPLATIGAHTVHHVALRRLDADHARREMADAVTQIERQLGECPRHMAYPYGYLSAVGEREAQLAEELSFSSAVTTRHGLVHPEHRDHLHALPRLSVNGRYQTLQFTRTMLSGLTAAMANRGRRVVTL